MSTILALDTSSETCSVAVYKDESTIKAYCERTPRSHTAKILPLIHQLLADLNIEFNELDALAFGAGPGSFTGLRIAAGVIQGLAYGLNKPVVTVSTLASLAHGTFSENPQLSYVLCAIDARMDEIYWGWYAYENGDVIQKSTEQVGKPFSVKDLPGRNKKDSYIGVGSGWKYAAEITPAIGSSPMICDPDVVPLAENIAALAAVKYCNGDICKAEAAQPSYIRHHMSYKKTSK